VNYSLVVKENDKHDHDFALQLSRSFRSVLNRICYSKTRVQLKLSSLKACLITVRVSIALLPRFAQHLMCSFVGSIAKSQLKTQKDAKISISTELHEILYTDSLDIYSTIIYSCIALIQLL
jgi:hypothetical protein